MDDTIIIALRRAETYERGMRTLRHHVTAAQAAIREEDRMARRFFYDCEFLEDGRTIDLISIGIVSYDDRELYLINADAPWRRILRHPWLTENVVPQLPRNPDRRRWQIDHDDPAVQPRHVIAAEVHRFLTGADRFGPHPAATKPELWAWYSAYDHVCLAQLFGPMVDMPAGLPQRTNDLKQEADRLGNPALPEQPRGEHHALEDARFLKRRYDWLKLYEQNRHGPEILT